jgi:L-lysine exporter family protein LysE/ArgO
MIFPLIKGFGLSFSLILAIGAQNAFILRMGLKRQHVFAVCLFAAISDAILIIVGIAGLGRILASIDSASLWLYLLAAAWLAVYGVFRLKDAWKGASSLEAGTPRRKTFATAMVMLAGLTWLNPHVYLDTVVLVGGIAATLPQGERLPFGIGAVAASFIFFFTLGYGSAWLGGHLENPKIWSRIDFGIAVVMFWIAAGLIFSAFNA